MPYALLVLCLVALGLPAYAGSTAGFSGGATFNGESSAARVRVRCAVIPDTQNYCTSTPAENTPGFPTAAELAIGRAHLDQLAADVVAWQPTFVIQVGDISDNSGSSIVDSSDPDNFVTDPTRYGEYDCMKTHLFDKLEAAGIPWFIVSGNHDSYRDFERAFPRATFLAKSYAIAAQNEVDRWHAGFADTESRAALIPTPIGTICVVGTDYDATPLGNQGNSIDQGFMNTNIGCAGSRPTILVSHHGIVASGPAPPLAAAGNDEVFMSVRGHVVPTIPGSMQTFSVAAAPGGFEYVDLFTDSQELSLTCGPLGAQVGDGTSIHTGATWWTMIEIVPATNSILIQARNPLYYGVARDPKCGNTYQNGVATLSPSFCTRFPGGPGC